MPSPLPTAAETIPPNGGRPRDRRDACLAAHTRDLLTEAQTATCRRRAAIIEQVVRDHLWLSRSLARRFGRRGVEDDDLLQVASTGLVQACHRFDPQAGDFVGFAAATILGLLKRHFRDHGWLIRPPRHLQELTVAIRQASPELVQDLATEPSVAELAERLGEPVEVVRDALFAGSGYRAVSLDGPASPGWLDDGGGAREQERCEARLMVESVWAGVSPSDRQLLDLRFVQERSQADIAGELGTTQMQVSRRLAVLLRRLRFELGELDSLPAPC